MKPCVFIHTNEKQIVGALVSQFSFKRFASEPAAFDVKLIRTDDYGFIKSHNGRSYLRDGLHRQWRSDDLQSFTVLRFLPPQLMAYQGRSLVVDPDVFCISDVVPLLTRDMGGHAVLARRRYRSKPGLYASSVMLLDNAKLKHWRVERDFEEMFTFTRDYGKWINLKLEPKGSIGELETVWNDFDELTPATRMLHNTKRRTQPWKTGLPVDFRPPERSGAFNLVHLLHQLRRSLFGEYGLLGRYARHPDGTQERLFFALLKECMKDGIITKEMLEKEMRLNHVRHDAIEVLEKTPTLNERPLFAN
ncbi:MAG TPA: hypothetical protein VH933_09560 [Aestuariivirgaceae bacterium]|jgi:hypothetical protein